MSDKLKEIRKRHEWLRGDCLTSMEMDDIDFLLSVIDARDKRIEILDKALQLSCDAERRIADGVPILSVWRTPEDYINKAIEEDELAQEADNVVQE